MIVASSALPYRRRMQTIIPHVWLYALAYVPMARPGYFASSIMRMVSRSTSSATAFRVWSAPPKTAPTRGPSSKPSAVLPLPWGGVGNLRPLQTPRATSPPPLALGLLLVGIAPVHAQDAFRAYGPGGPLPAMREAAEVFSRANGVTVEVAAGPTPPVAAEGEGRRRLHLQRR